MSYGDFVGGSSCLLLELEDDGGVNSPHLTLDVHLASRTTVLDVGHVLRRGLVLQGRIDHEDGQFSLDFSKGHHVQATIDESVEELNSEVGIHGRHRISPVEVVADFGLIPHRSWANYSIFTCYLSTLMF